MARITVEDCVDKVESPYDLVLIAKERAVQLNSGEKPTVEPEKDKNTVIALREIAEEKISTKKLEDSAINKLRKHVEETVDTLDLEETEGDDFENIYKGEISKSGIPILPSKRARKIPEKIETTDQKEKIETADQKEKIETADQKEKIETADQKEKIETADQKEKIETTDQKEKIQEKENSSQDEEVSLEELREQEKKDEESDELNSSETSET